MTENIIKNERIKEEYFKIKHHSGLEIILYPMKGYKTSCAMFGSKYGSIDNSFKIKGEKDFLKVPDGIAHYLEHKLFESEDKDAFSLFAQTGASANAFTSFDRTVYYFTTTDNFYKSLDILINFVLNPYFTDENVQKEQGIIGQEIKMYDDEPSWRVMFNCLGGMYHNHPVKVDIAGDINSISKINKEYLYKCYNMFYNMNNMVLVATGDFDNEKIKDIVNRNIDAEEIIEIQRENVEEPKEVVGSIVETKLSVSQPQFCIGFKLKALEGIDKLKADIQFEILNKILMGKSSELFKSFYESGLVAAGEVANETFSGRGYYAILFLGESKRPKEVYKKIKEEIEKYQHMDEYKEDFELAKKDVYGKIIRGFDSANAVANLFMDSAMLGVDAFDMLEITANVEFCDIKNRLNTINVEDSTLSIVNPN